MNTRIYHFGFRTDDTDNTLELAEFGGCSGRSNSEHAPVVADLVEARTQFASEWGMTDNQQRRVAKDRQSMMSVPVFAREQRDSESEQVVPIRAILSIDSSSSLEESGWIEKTENGTPSVTKRVTELAIEWAAVVSKLLS